MKYDIIINIRFKKIKECIKCLNINLTQRGGGTNKRKKLLILLLSSFISLTPITTIIACNKKDQITDEGSNIDKTVELFNVIKTEISDILNSSESKIYLDAKELKLENQEVKKILDPIFQDAQKAEEEIFVKDNRIIDKITEKIKNIVNDLNIKLKKLPVLENSSNIIVLNSLQAKMNGNDIKTLIDLIDKKPKIFASEINDSDFDYNLQLKLNFQINVQNKEDSYVYNPKSVFITNNKKDLDNKILNLASKLSTSLANQELNGKNIINNALNNNSYVESFSNELNHVLKDKNIKIEKSKNMEINREELSFQLKTLIENISNGDATYLNNFAKLINDSEVAITTSEKLFSETDSDFYQFKNYVIEENKIFTKNFKEFIITKWSIEGIDLPERTLNNIKIYHEISEIKNSWRNFYEILKFYLHPKERDNWKFNNGWYRVAYKIFKDHEELKKEDKEKRLYQWANNVKKQIEPEYLEKFLVNIADITNKNFTSPEGHERIRGSIQLFSNELSLYLVKKYDIAFYYSQQ